MLASCLIPLGKMVNTSIKKKKMGAAGWLSQWSIRLLISGQ